MTKNLLLIFTVFALFSCDKSDVDVKSDTFEVSLDGEAFKAEGALAYWTDFSDGSFNAYGIVDDLTIYIGFESNVVEGQQTVSDDVYVYAVYDGGKAYATLVDGSSGTVNLVKKDATNLQGSFNVVVTNFEDENDKLTLDGGSFNVTYR